MPVSADAAIGMALTALVLVITPGPNMMYLVSRSISQGRRAGFVSLAGTGVGFVIYMVAANLGFAALFVVVPWLYIGLKVSGVCYIAYLAYQALRPGGRGVFEPTALGRDSDWKLFRTGLITNLLNPKAAVLYLALIPQFVDPRHGDAVLQGFILGAIQITISMILNATWVVIAGSIAHALRRRPRLLIWQRRLSGTLLGAVAVLLAREVPARARP
ncbi:MAG TPA: LysE family translocator [Acidimicrobiales bacterium]|jgi:threonine/homoserine/homoserine lactone efflux protein